MIQEIDWSVGEIIKMLEKLDLVSNTYVIFTSDNGPWLAYKEHAGNSKPLRDGKGTTFEGGMRVVTYFYGANVKPGIINDLGVQTDFFNKQYTNVKGYFAFIAVNRWFGARLDMINMFYLTIFIFMAIFFQRFHNEFGMNSLDDGLVGMSLTYILSLCDVFQWCVRQSAEVENLMVSTERILAYIKLPSEPPHKVPKDAVVKKQNWPQKGELELKNLSIL